MSAFFKKTLCDLTGKYFRYIFLLRSAITASMLILCFSCERKEQQIIIPDNILSKEKMALVVADIHIEEAKTYLHAAADSASKPPAQLDNIFDAHKITKEEYEKSLSFYVDHPILLNEVYEEALNELSKRQAAK